ncbi:MAG: TrmH family RNA methyltransferase, partial [Desulfotomaculales bacterium]
MTGKNSTTVNSPQNPRLKYVRRLAGRRFREREGKFLVEGSLLVEEALLSRWPLELLVYTEEWKKSLPGRKILALAKRAAVPLLEVAAGIFAELAGTQSP